MKVEGKMSNSLADSDSRARIGMFGVGYDKYWGQFPGLLEELTQKQQKLFEKLIKSDSEVIDFGIIDSPRRAYDKVSLIAGANLDMVFCDMLTYATSGTFGIIIKTLDIPIVLVALQPMKAMDYTRASTYMQLCNDDI
jgi:L-arabinose isomerase